MAGCSALGPLYAALAVALRLVSAGPGLSRTVLKELAPGFPEELAALAGDVARRHLQTAPGGARCLALLRSAAARDGGLAAFLATLSLPLVAVEADAAAGPGPDSLRLLVPALNARCRGWVARARRPQELVAAVAEAARHAAQRAPARYLLLPFDPRPRAQQSVLEMSVMKYMPDLVEVTAATTEADGNATETQAAESEAEASSLLLEASTQLYAGAGDAWRARVPLGAWRAGAWLRGGGAGLFPDKLRDLRGREFAFAVFNYPPYVILPDGAPPDGMELRISEELARKLNFRWRPEVDLDHDWGEIFDNFTGNGILGAVAEDRADLGFAALYLWFHEFQFLDFSCPYIRTGITCLVPRPKLIPGWMAPILPFTSAMWIALGVSLVVSSVSLFLVTQAALRMIVAQGQEPPQHGRYDTLWDCVFCTVGLLVLQTPDSERHEDARETGPARHVINWLNILFLLLTSSYAGGLASVLSVPRYEPPVDTARQLVDSPFLWAATEDAWIFSLLDSEDPLMRKVTQRFRAMDTAKLRRRAAAGDIAFGVERLPNGHFAVGEYIDELAVSRLRLMGTDLYWERSTTVARKGSPLIEPLSALVNRLLDAGLVGVWERQVARRYLSARVQDAVRLSGAAATEHEPRRFTMEQVEGPFALLVLGLAVCGAVFLLELGAGWWGRLRCRCRRRRSRDRGPPPPRPRPGPQHTLVFARPRPPPGRAGQRLEPSNAAHHRSFWLASHPRPN